MPALGGKRRQQPTRLPIALGTGWSRQEGVEPLALLSLLARIGTSQPVEPVTSLERLAETFDFSHFGRAPAHFDPHEVELLNARLLHHLDYAALADRLPAGEAIDRAVDLLPPHRPRPILAMAD